MSDVELSTEAQYAAAQAEIDRLVDLEPEKGSPEHDELLRLYGLLQTYDQERTQAHSADDLPAEEGDG